jgi:hypothetical protein
VVKRHAFEAEPVRDERRPGRRLENLEQVAGVVAIVVGEVDPPDVSGIDDLKGMFEPFRARERRPPPRRGGGEGDRGGSAALVGVPLHGSLALALASLEQSLRL